MRSPDDGTGFGELTSQDNIRCLGSLSVVQEAPQAEELANLLQEFFLFPLWDAFHINTLDLYCPHHELRAVSACNINDWISILAGDSNTVDQALAGKAPLHNCATLWQCTGLVREAASIKLYN